MESLLLVLAVALGIHLTQKRSTTDVLPYAIAFIRAAKTWNIPLPLMLAISEWETGGTFDPKIVNFEREADIKKGRNVDSIGLMAILWPDTAQFLDPQSTREKLFDVQYNLNLGGQYLDKQFKRYNESRDKNLFPYQTVASYNAGSAKYINDGTFINQKYVNEVYSRWQKWSQIT